MDEDEIPQLLDFSAEEEEPSFEKETVSPPTTTLMQRKKKKGDEESLEDRFKLRNGKEVRCITLCFNYFLEKEL